ncbi:MAG: histidinol dehydrogenase [Actinomycetaceae bacterium]|nr:histidinol dehydrogenase [Actinomycetaceae bacterium]
MMSILDLREKDYSASQLAQKLPRASLDIDGALKHVAPIIEDVRAHGGAAIRRWTRKFDLVDPKTIRVPASALKEALEGLDPQVREGLEISIRNNRLGHEAQLPQERVVEIVPGGFVRQRWIPARRVGLYVPGGLAVYPSSVVMNVVAAKVAGVESIAVASPAQKEFGGLPHPTILAACELLGVDEVYSMGGAQAIAGFAFGFTDEADAANPCEPVDVVTGPGNIFVAAAKRAVKSVVGIDAEAGTTEIAIIADEEANPRFVARDLISQAEHDPAAASVLITHSEQLVAAVEGVIEEMARATKHSERIRAALSGPQSGIVLTRDLAQSVFVANTYAAEHLEIQTKDAAGVAKQIRNAGAIFVGPYSPVPLGDYVAGSNHVLPTGGTARFASGLNVHAYLKSVQEIEYSREALAGLTPALVALANSEDLPAHGEAATERA